MSDLQCAATFLITCPGDLEGSRALAGSLRDRRVSMVYSSSAAHVVRTAETLAAELGVGMSLCDDGSTADQSENQSEQQVADRMRSELETAADLHRGETVLYLSHADAIRVAVPRLAGGISDADAKPLVPCDVVEVAVDADGWVLRSWAGRRLG